VPFMFRISYQFRYQMNIFPVGATRWVAHE